MSDIISQLKNAISPQLLSGISQAVGESESGITKALGGIFPLLLGSIMKKAGEPGATNVMGDLMGLLKGAPSSDDLLSNPVNLLEALSGKGDLGSLAAKFLPLILGNNSNDATSFLSNIAGIKSSSASSLLALAAPLVIGQLKKTLGGNLSLNGLLSFLVSQKSSIIKAAPAGLSSALGIASLDNLGANVTSHLSSAAAHAQLAAKKGFPKMPLLLILALLLAGFFFWKTCVKEKINIASVQEIIEVKAEPVKKMWEHLGKFFSVTLPSGIELKIPELGIENKLLAFLNNSSLPIDPVTCFSFDRLLFETGSATLKAGSNEQLNNIAEILKAYPNVEIKIGGYTDATGNPEANLRLSQERADSVKVQLTSQGIADNRIEAMGYGEEHPIAPNDTVENRAKNRRIDILVTKK